MSSKCSTRHFLKNSLGVILAIACAFFPACRHRKPPAVPNIDALTATLKKSAEQTLPAPSLAREQITIDDAPDRVEKRAQQIIDAATKSGGTAVKMTNQDGSISLLAKIPDANSAAFLGAARGESQSISTNADSAISTSGTESELIDIHIHPRATPQQSQPSQSQQKP